AGPVVGVARRRRKPCQYDVDRRSGRARRPGGKRARRAQQPATQLPLPSNCIVLPLSGTCTGIFAALWNAAVRLLGVSLPLIVAGSFACEAITDFGCTSSLTT